MINRDNYAAVNRYLKYQAETLQRSPKTVREAKFNLIHLLIWLDDCELQKAPERRPTMPEYILTARRDDGAGRLSPNYMRRCLDVAKAFFLFARRESPQLQKAITENWLDTLRVKREFSTQSRLEERDYWELADIRKILAITPNKGNTLRVLRDKAAISFLFLSGMRGTAFVTLPVEAVDLDRATVKQLPELGVKTKNSKAAITFLFPIPDLMKAIKEWDDVVRSMGPRSPWYGRIFEDGKKIIAEDVGAIKPTGRRAALWAGLKELCNLAGVKFKSPHKLRHGHGVYGVKKSKDMAQLKALSQNMMHANIGITDGIYGRLKSDDVKNILAGFTESEA